MRNFVKLMFISWFNRCIYSYISKGYIKLANRKLKLYGCKKEKLRKEEIFAIKEIWDGLNVPYSYKWFIYYKNCTGDFNPLYVPNEVFNALVEVVFNPIMYVNCMAHKGILDKFINKEYLPRIIVNRIEGNIYEGNGNPISENDACLLVYAEDEIIVKYSIASGGGNGVEFISLFHKSIQEKQKLLQEIFHRDNLDIVVQNVIKQHPDFARFNNKSVNTVRLVSLNLNGKVSVLSSFLRMGQGEMRVDNLNSGGMLVGIMPDGRLHPRAVDGASKEFLYSPQGVRFDQCQIQYYALIKEKAIELHSRLPFVKLIGWDFTVDIDGRIKVIEINLNSQQIEYQQMYNGPLFGERTREVIEYIRTNPARRFIYG